MNQRPVTPPGTEKIMLSSLLRLLLAALSALSILWAATWLSPKITAFNADVRGELQPRLSEVQTTITDRFRERGLLGTRFVLMTAEGTAFEVTPELFAQTHVGQRVCIVINDAARLTPYRKSLEFGKCPAESPITPAS